jgi:hypothetical protein
MLSCVRIAADCCAFVAFSARPDAQCALPFCLPRLTLHFLLLSRRLYEKVFWQGELFLRGE